MSVATVTENKTGKKPHYKDYVSFLENYKGSRKDDQNSVITNDSGVSFSLNNSSNNSSSSVYSDLSEPSKNGFKEYLDNYNSKRYSSVQPPGSYKKQTQQNETKTVKTEVFLEINNPPTVVSKVVDIRNAQNVSTVSKVSKIFEKNIEQNFTKTMPPSGKVNTFNFETDGHNNTTTNTGKTYKTLLKKSNSISEKSRVFEDSKTKNNEPSKPFQKDSNITTARPSLCVSGKPPVNNTKPVLVPKIVTAQQTEDYIAPKTNGSTSPKPLTSIKPIIVPKALTSTLVFHQKEDVPPPKTNINISNGAHTEKSSQVHFVPPPPPPPLPEQKQLHNSFQNPSSNTPQPSVPNLVQQSTQNGPCNVPPPPPPPPANFSVKIVQNSPSKTSLPVQKVVVNGVGTGPKHNDTVDGAAQPVVDKSDPRVKKLVYGALREMYGAYHDKANDYIATLPRNRVKKNNGLDSIISSIASQGGLEKLSGRSNPSVETE